MMRELNALKAKQDERNARLDKWISGWEMSAQLHLNVAETVATNTACYVGGERRAHVKIRIPVWLSDLYLRFWWGVR